MSSMKITTGITADIRDRQDRNHGAGTGMLRFDYLQHPRVYAKPSWRVVKHLGFLSRQALCALLAEPAGLVGVSASRRPIAAAAAC